MDSRTDSNLNSDGTGVFSQVIRSPGAVWLRLHFGDIDLGRRAHLSITSVLDGGNQILDGRTLLDWENSSAVFNGDEVRIELKGSSVDEGIFFTVDRLVVGDPQDGPTPSRCVEWTIVWHRQMAVSDVCSLVAARPG